MTELDLHTLDNEVRAIYRLDAGTYGRCTACDEPIEPARLAALPEAADCMECVQLAQETPPQWAVSVGDDGARRGARAASEPAT
jgi:RNA polymerase-binding transcription factor DksA